MMAVPRDKAVTLELATVEVVNWSKAVGMIKPPVASARRDAAVPATVTLKCCSERRSPPKKKHMPITSRRLESMDPTRDVFTMTVSFLTRARMATISSTALLLWRKDVS